jgi:hypothetical protein
MRNSIVARLALAIACQGAYVLTGCGPGVTPSPQSGIVGKWHSADGSYNVEFLPTGKCSARLRMQGREVGGPCTYTFDQQDITLHYPGMQPGGDATATWHYTLAGDVLTVSVFGNSVTLQRTH